jgi:hypothetical protein
MYGVGATVSWLKLTGEIEVEMQHPPGGNNLTLA